MSTSFKMALYYTCKNTTTGNNDTRNPLLKEYRYNILTRFFFFSGRDIFYPCNSSLNSSKKGGIFKVFPPFFLFSFLFISVRT